MPTDQTIDFVVLFLTIGLLIMGLGSALIGWLMRVWDRVKYSHNVMTISAAQTATDQQTDGQTDQVSEADLWLDRIEVDRTKTAIIELMVYSGWTVGEVRAIVKGDNAAIGIEVAAARERLGTGDDPPRMLKVRDQAGEREIVFEKRH